MQADQSMIYRYNAGESTIQLSKDYNKDPSTIQRALKYAGVKMRPMGRNAGKYQCNEHFFDTIDTEEKAYILGMLYTDGCLSKEKYNYSVNISLAEQDVDILYKIKQTLDSTHRLYEVPPGKNSKQIQYRLSICNKHLHNTLIQHGCTPCKSHTITFPRWMPDHLMPHFIRGCMDGDGSYQEMGGHQLRITYVGSRTMCLGMQAYFVKHLKLNVYLYARKADDLFSISQLQLNSRYAAQLVYWMYDEAHIYGQRKYDKIQSILNTSVTYHSLDTIICPTYRQTTLDFFRQSRGLYRRLDRPLRTC